MSAAHAAERGQHFLRSPQLAQHIVRDSGVGPGDLVLDIGAGFGRLTRPLLETGARVVAIERDAKLARSVQRRYPDARVVCDDALIIALPRRPFHVVANLPFGISTAMVRRLVASPHLLSADVIVGRGFALKSGFPIVRWLSRRVFMPPPSTDAAVIRICYEPDPRWRSTPSKPPQSGR